MARRIAAGIDIGTFQVKVVVTEEVRTRGGVFPRVIGTGLAESKGLRHGYIVSKIDVTESVSEAKRQAESAAGISVGSAFLAIGGISLDEARGTGEVIISRADQEITELDLEKTLLGAREQVAPALKNRLVLHEIPLEHRLDGARVFGTPRGMKGLRLESDYLFVTCLAQHAEALGDAVEDAGIEIIDRMASPLAGSYVVLSREQKMRGCVLANIGAETVSLVVYDYGIPVSVKVFPVGSANITDDLALGLRIIPEEAERLKLGRLGGAMYPRKKIEEIIAARFSDLFALVDKHLKAINKRVLPAGVILSGGGSGAGVISEIAKHSLSLPARIAELKIPESTKIRDATWAVAYGLTIWGLTGDTNGEENASFRDFGKGLRRFFRQFLP